MQTGLLVQSLSWLGSIFGFCLLSFFIWIILVQFILKPFQWLWDIKLLF